ncbi:hypothetical protein T439DRAFT_375374 [Meredithblackwellia eburnea MCA 4105]
MAPINTLAGLTIATFATLHSSLPNITCQPGQVLVSGGHAPFSLSAFDINGTLVKNFTQVKHSDKKVELDWSGLASREVFIRVVDQAGETASTDNVKVFDSKTCPIKPHRKWGLSPSMLRFVICLLVFAGIFGFYAFLLSLLCFLCCADACGNWRKGKEFRVTCDDVCTCESERERRRQLEAEEHAKEMRKVARRQEKDARKHARKLARKSHPPTIDAVFGTQSSNKPSAWKRLATKLTSLSLGKSSPLVDEPRVANIGLGSNDNVVGVEPREPPPTYSKINLTLPAATPVSNLPGIAQFERVEGQVREQPGRRGLMSLF